MIVQIDLKHIENHFIFFYMNCDRYGMWLHPIGDMIEYWSNCIEVVIVGYDTNKIISREEWPEVYDGSQNVESYNFEENQNILNFEFPDEETALYFKLKFGGN